MGVEGRDEPLDRVGTEPDGPPPARQVPSQAGPGRADGYGSGGGYDGADADAAAYGEAYGAEDGGGGCGTVLPGPWPAAVESDDASVPMQREGRAYGGGGPAAPTPTSDASLVERMRAGDDSAYEELFRRHSDAVRRYARSCCRDAHTADDLTAEVFARTLQAVRGGAGPAHAVRAYLLTTVRRVAAAWTKTARREHLVEDFAVFAAQSARSVDASDDDTLELGADVRAMHEAEQTLAMQAFRSLPERWQAVLWHTTVEEESPSEVAPLFGLTANATAVLASRAREGLKQAYLQAHVSTALTAGGDCARYADRLGAYARGGLRTRAERGLRKHLEECAQCRVAAGELSDVNAGIPALLPVAVIGWFAAGYAVKAAGLVAGGAAGAVGAAGAGAAAAAAGGGSGAAGGAAGAAAGEAVGAPVKVAIGAAVAVAVTAGVVFALAGEDPKPEVRAVAKPPASRPAVPQRPTVKPPAPSAPRAPKPPVAAPEPSPKPTRPAPSTPSAPEADPAPKPKPPAPAPPEPEPTPPPAPTPPPPPPPAAPVVYQVNTLKYGAFGDRTEPEVRVARSSWLWQRYGVSIGGVRYGNGVTTHAKSSVTIDLNRACTTYDALVGIDDMTMGIGAARFSLYGDGALLWRSGLVRGNDGAVAVRAGISGRKSIRLVVEPEHPHESMVLADWAHSRISCEG
ncbi:sigma-70 family RNA polymerase sigma factor [Streptomyces albidochromogenes]|uniref:Sigma-70 family RNA polymerase sigma factor n=1 Tax=Streptomyces albidochromogenes TaxID=329524 RepID=A0ABW6FU70_9ACTN